MRTCEWQLSSKIFFSKLLDSFVYLSLQHLKLPHTVSPTPRCGCRLVWRSLRYRASGTRAASGLRGYTTQRHLQRRPLTRRSRRFLRRIPHLSSSSAVAEQYLQGSSKHCSSGVGVRTIAVATPPHTTKKRGCRFLIGTRVGVFGMWGIISPPRSPHPGPRSRCRRCRPAGLADRLVG